MRIPEDPLGLLALVAAARKASGRPTTAEQEAYLEASQTRETERQAAKAQTVRNRAARKALRKGRK